MRYRWAVSLVIMCGFGVTQAAAEDGRPLITPPALADELCAAAKDGRIYGRVEGMVWFIRDAHTPPLITFGSAADPIPGALDQPGTRIAFGGNIDTGTHGGAQFTLGYWFTNDKEMGLEATYWFLNRRTASYAVFGSGAVGSPVIARPFFDPNLLIENSDIVALPGVQSGFTTARLTDRLEGGEFNLLVGATGDSWYHIGLIAGVRVFNLAEDLDLSASTAALPAGTGIFDSNFETFHVSNQYAGGQIGFDLALRNDALVFDVRGTAGIGGNWEQGVINRKKSPNAP